MVNQVWKQSGAAVDEFQYGYDLMGNVKYKLNVVADDLAKAGGTPATPYLDELYTYDNLGQLNEVQRGEIDPTSITSGLPSMLSTTLDKQWTLDGMGNWRQVTTNGTVTSTSTFNHANENNAFSYDQNGNMTNDGNQKYAYDAWNRLVEVDDSSRVPVAMYRYDGTGRLVEEATGFDSTHKTWQTAANFTHYYYAAGDMVETRVHGRWNARRQPARSTNTSGRGRRRPDPPRHVRRHARGCRSPTSASITSPMPRAT